MLARLSGCAGPAACAGLAGLAMLAVPPVPAKASANNKVLLLEVLALIVIPVSPSLFTTKFLPLELKDEGLVDGKKIGFALKELENEWIKNNFKLDQEKITNIINRAKDSNILNI